MSGTAPSKEQSRFAINLRQLHWHRLYAPLLLCLALALYTTIQLGRGGIGFWVDLAFSFWSMRLLFVLALILMWPKTYARWMSALLMLPVAIAYIWQVGSLELYAVQMRFLSFKEVSDLFNADATRGIIWEQLISIRVVLFFIIFYSVYFFLDHRLKKWLPQQWSMLIVLVVVPLLIIGQVSSDRGVHRDRLVYANARVCMPWSSAHRILERIPIANLAQAQAHWLQKGSPMWEKEPSSYFSAFGDRYHGRSVVVILLESHALMNIDRFVEDAVGAKPSSPFLSALYDQGIGFEEYFATGFSTSSAAWSLLASAPYFDAVSFSPHLAQLGTIPDFQARKYHVDWLKAASIEFAHFHELTRNLNIAAGIDDDESMRMKALDDTYWTAWGMPDEQIFQVSLDRVQKKVNEQQPFLHFVLTVSNHIPFKFPKHLDGHTLTRDYFGGMRYADHALRQYITGIQRIPEDQRPIVFITADTAYRGEGTYLFDQDSIPVEPSESLRVPALLLLPDGARPVARIQQLSNHEDALPFLAELVGVQTAYRKRYQTSRRRVVAIKDYEGFSIISPKHYLYGTSFLMKRKTYWRYAFSDLASDIGTDLLNCRHYLHETAESIWQQKEGETVHRENNWDALSSPYPWRNRGIDPSRD